MRIDQDCSALCKSDKEYSYLAKEVSFKIEIHITSVPTFGTSLVEQESHLIVTHLEFDPKGQQLGRVQTC